MTKDTLEWSYKLLLHKRLEQEDYKRIYNQTVTFLNHLFNT